MFDVNWHGHDFAFRVRVDVEHVESERYIGDYRLERVSVVNMLDMFAELGVHVSFCVLGVTAELYPNLINDIVEAGHEVYGHGMYHEPAFAGRPYREQRHEMLRMRQSIADACGVEVDGIGCPHHGMADEDTLKAAADVGITYVESRIRGTDSAVPVWRSIEDSDKQVLVPGGLGKGASDYTDRRPFWADLHEEAFSPTGARRKWMALIDWAKENRSMAGLVVHPWMLMINAGEVQVVKDVIRYAVDEGGWMATVGGLISLVEQESPSTPLRAGSGAGEREK
jgi:peptidoglycan/xylan/chitin deacetylase (PgdA/CDA1 family)